MFLIMYLVVCQAASVQAYLCLSLHACLCFLLTHASSASHLRPIWFFFGGSRSCSHPSFKAGPRQRQFPPLTHKSTVQAALPVTAQTNPCGFFPNLPSSYPHFLSSIALEMGSAVNITSLCASSLRLSWSRQREERSCGIESLFPLLLSSFLFSPKPRAAAAAS